MYRQTHQDTSGDSGCADQGRDQPCPLLPAATGPHQDAHRDGVTAPASQYPTESTKRERCAQDPGGAASAPRTTAHFVEGVRAVPEARDVVTSCGSITAGSAAVLGDVLDELRNLRRDFRLCDELQKELDRLRSDLANRDVLRPILTSLIEISEGLSNLGIQLAVKSKQVPREPFAQQLQFINVRADRSLKRYGLRMKAVKVGDRFAPELHQIAESVPASSPATIGTIAKVRHQAFIEDTGRVWRPALVDVFVVS